MKTIASRLAHKLPAALWLMCQISSPAADVSLVAVVKGQEFTQTSANIVSLGEWQIWNKTGEVQNEGDHPEPIHVFDAFAIGTAPGALISGSVTPPGRSAVPMQKDDSELFLEGGGKSPAELDANWPDGSYTVTIQRLNDGPLNVALSLTGSTYPPVPKVIGFDALQTANAAGDLNIQWSAMGGGIEDFIQLSVSTLDDGSPGGDEIVFKTGMPGMPGALNGTSTGALIPAGTLEAGRDYQGEIRFVKTTDVKTSPALCIAGYYKLTGFRIRTSALPSTALGATLLRSNPKDGWMDVPRDSAVAFHFSHPMTPAHISIAWTKDGGPLSTGTFNYHWTQGNTVLLCKFSNDLPPDSQVGWTLNLPGFRDAANFPLSGSPSGSFHTSMDTPESPPDVGFISMLKTKYHIQTGPTPVADGKFEASAEMDANAANLLKTATVTALTGSLSGPLYADPWDGDEYEAPGEYGSKTDLDRFYPNGDYQFAMDGLDDGSKNVTLSLGSTDQYPAAPTVTNLTLLQAVNPTAPVTVTWGAFSGWTNDLESMALGDGWIEFEILDRNGQDVFWVEGTEMTNGVSCVIPAGTLPPGRSYQANLFFLRITDIDKTSAFAVAAFESVTSFTMQTTGEPLMPKLAVQRIGNIARVTANGGETNLPYALEASHNLQHWAPLERYWNNGLPHQFDDNDAQYLKARFYRVRDSGIFEQVTPHIAIQGTVWTNSSHSTPVAAAVVGTSLDGKTTVTDAQGRFFLVTDTPSQNGGALYTITVTAGAQNRSFGPWNWGDQPRNQVLEMQ